ncbi:hypothetical protein QQZ08_006274 [Neonectria magnoliae]|uniref:AB hydrolase-1 domain-containing protein n=1 Tax=Neonectria magnoliae TaxID=2732573 RepID=A0ABR1I1F7_9HYPO
MASQSKKCLLTFRLPTSNRQISWAEFGSPTGRPVISLHGTSSCRLEFQQFHEELYEKNIRIIAPDRPGIGRSEFQPNRTIGGYASDVQALAKHLELQEYTVMGTGVGGSFALACARHINPDDGLKAVGVLSGIAPWDCSLNGMFWMNKINLYMAKWNPGLFKRVYDISWPGHKELHTVPLEELVVDPSVEEKLVARMESTSEVFRPKDQEVMKRPGRREDIASTLAESFIQGTDGYIYETDLTVKKWDFKLKDIKFASDRHRPLVLWFGTEDEQMPMHMGRWMAKRISGADFRQEAGDTHMLINLKFVKFCEELLELAQR